MVDSHKSTATAKSATETARLHREFESVVGHDNVKNDAESIELYSRDIWSTGAATTSLVVSPVTLDQVSRVAAAATKAGFAIATRGGGMSYTGGYVPQVEGTVSLDMSKMSRVLEIRPDDMTVTVEAGCTWATLNKSLAPLGLRTPFWGPMSGLMSTVGGGLSQLNAVFGSGHYGTSSESVVALTVVLSDGSVIRTGARGVCGDAPFYRHYGPDLAGLFMGDCGVFGIKAVVTLRLIRTPAHEGYVSLAFKSGHDLLLAMADITRAGVACESCGLDPRLLKLRLRRESIMQDAKTLRAVISKQKSLYKGLLEASKIALAGRSIADPEDYTLHLVCEGRSKAGMEADISEIRRIGSIHGGVEIENTVGKVMRAEPFPTTNAVLGPLGERWVPVHGVVPLSQANAILEKIEDLFAASKENFEAAYISPAIMFTHLSTNAIIIEPLFYWPEERFAVHESAVDPSYLEKLPKLDANPIATSLVAETRRRIIAIFESYGCGHFQIGRTYPYRTSRDHGSRRILESIKEAVDPQYVFNPGGLGI
jgi:FAD/FMN-containing dehydrogenase